MSKEQLRAEVEKIVAFTRRNVAPDDIYLFAVEVIWTAHYLIENFCELEGFQEMINENETLENAVLNILSFTKSYDENKDIKINMDRYFSE